jgi:cytochrome c-type biogenesis protein CcmH/NrfG
MRNLRFFPFLTIALLVSAFLAVAAPEPPQSAKGADHNRKGLEYYDEAFYGQLPKGKHREADAFFDLAAAEFREAIAANPKNVEAHRNLARLYYVRSNFLQAADAYRTVTILEPQNIDAYVQVDRFKEAIQELETAKTKTDNPEVIGKLDGYIRKIKEHR